MNKIVVLVAVLVVVEAVESYDVFKERFTYKKNETCILLTTTVYINTSDYKNDYNSPDSRLKIYTDSIDMWLNKTDRDIYVVESSNYNFPQYRDNPRVKVLTFKSSNDIECKHCSATPYEAESILRAFYYFNLGSYENIIKVTGKYFIPGVEELIKNIPSDAELFFQNADEPEYKKQNSEIFGCKSIYLKKINKNI
jgi:hypothetical protein